MAKETCLISVTSLMSSTAHSCLAVIGSATSSLWLVSSIVVVWSSSVNHSTRLMASYRLCNLWLTTHLTCRLLENIRRTTTQLRLMDTSATTDIFTSRPQTEIDCTTWSMTTSRAHQMCCCTRYPLKIRITSMPWGLSTTTSRNKV